MKYKYFAAIVASGLMIAYVAPVIFKIREVSLIIVVLIGVAMLLIDLWQYLHSKGD